MQCNTESMTSSSLVAAEDMDSMGRCRHRVRFVSTAVHELLGHGAGKLLHEDSDGSCNFDKEHRPLNPVTGRPVETWYKPGQVWTTVFEDIATSVEECRASLVAAYLMSEANLTEIFGYSETSEVTHDECTWLHHFWALWRLTAGSAVQHVPDVGSRRSRGTEELLCRNKGWRLIILSVYVS